MYVWYSLILFTHIISLYPGPDTCEDFAEKCSPDFYFCVINVTNMIRINKCGKNTYMEI